MNLKVVSVGFQGLAQGVLAKLEGVLYPDHVIISLASSGHARALILYFRTLHSARARQAPVLASSPRSALRNSATVRQH